MPDAVDLRRILSYQPVGEILPNQVVFQKVVSLSHHDRTSAANVRRLANACDPLIRVHLYEKPRPRFDGTHYICSDVCDLHDFLSSYGGLAIR